ncbi:collagen type IV alpha-3-binding protein [Exaiptasia diaphana]|uniref:Ceramide transfer protein n=1 Tax=Exaiptasia diaphana TaxID=2652724 RepID=A0A913XI10_EXADI|nr:collagen type IV alpha-3-binding protein [Exaiptasia diaphana]KXJ11899.1 Collagen type IV alpha-3-binding protein [Exaiptasia diaphana]
MSGDHTPSLSDEDEEDGLEVSSPIPSMQGYLSKWTNYLHGWQERWVVLKDGTLSYYKSEFDTAFGCRGSISLAKATIENHEYDECRFDVSVNDCMYYLRAKDCDARQTWVDALEAVKAAESGYGSESSLRKGGSMLSLSSVTSLGKSSTSSFKKTKGLREKLLELETFKDIIGRQIDTLQSYFDACAEVTNGLQLNSIDLNHHDEIFDSSEGLDHDADDEMDELSKTPTPSSLAERVNTKGKVNSTLEALARGIDFRGESITFKATTAGILATLAHCIDIMTKREDYWHRRLEKEIEKRKKAEASAKDAVANARKQAFIGGPDFEEGPHCALNEEEFYDAMEIGLDRQEEQDEIESKRRTCTIDIPEPPLTIKDPPHRMTEEVESKVRENLQIIKENVDENWYLVHEDGDMKVFRREYEEGGIILDPMKATHVIQGVTAREMAHYFFDKDVRMDFDSTIDYFDILERLTDSTLIFHQVLKRIWPSSQRDFVFCSHIQDISPEDEGERLDNEVGYAWLVTNYSVDHPDAPINKFVRVTCNVAMFCQTLIEPREEGQPLTRDHISCRITYSANVNPGGWAPPSVVRALSKREYPKFLRKVTALCQNAYKDKEIAI